MIWFTLSTFVVILVEICFKIQISHALDDITSTSANNMSNLTEQFQSGNLSEMGILKIPLFLGGYFTLGGIWDGSGILPAVEMALNQINERTDILPEYELKMVWNDTRVS